jgi:SAM-dependent methyltransferase
MPQNDAISTGLSPDILERFPLHKTEAERIRTADLLRLIPKDRDSVLDIGARDGFFSALLGRYFRSVTALDLTPPSFHVEGVAKVQGDVTRLQFPDNSFDVVFCAEVLEHVPDVERACREIARVARYEAVIGVPYKQDLRAARTTCRACARANPAWGHIHRFDEARLRKLFAPMAPETVSFVGSSHAETTAVSALLMDLGGNPWGTYGQQEPCIHCGAKLTPPGKRSLWQRAASLAASRINALAGRLAQRHGNWIHVVFRKMP